MLVGKGGGAAAVWRLAAVLSSGLRLGAARQSGNGATVPGGYRWLLRHGRGQPDPVDS